MPLVPVPTIDPGLGNVPNPSDDEVIFDADAFDFTTRMPGFGADIKAIGDATYTNAQYAETKAGEAATSAGTATTKAGEALISANNAATSANNAALATAKFQGEFATDPALNKTGGPLTAGDWYINTVSGLIRAYTGTAFVNSVNVTAGVDSINGLAGAVNSPTQAEAEAGTEATKPMTALRTAQAIAALSYNGKIQRSARTSNTLIAASDSAKWIDITSGTFTQTFAPAATLGNGWWCYLGNSGTGDITLDPDGSETIDGLSSYVMYPGEVRLVQCDGVSLRTAVINAFYKEWTSSDIFIKPPGYRLFEGLLWGGGGSGAKGNSTTPAYGPGAGGGACNPIKLKQSAVPPSTVVTIAATTVAPTAANMTGSTGGTSSFGTLAYAYGGSGGDLVNSGGGGIYSAGVSASNTSGSKCGGDPQGYVVSANTAGAFGGGGGGGAGTSSSAFGGGGNTTSSTPGISVHGGGGGGTSNPTTLRPGGISIYGGSGGNGGVGLTGNAQDGLAPGGGGGGTCAGTAGAGARGELRLWGVI